MRFGRLALAAVLVFFVFPARAAAEPDPPMEFKTPATCQTDGGSTVRVSPGVYMSTETWERLDTEVRRLQESETRLRAERDSILDDVDASRWKFVVGAASGIVVGFAIGYTLDLKL